MSVTWIPRTLPLGARAVVASGEVARALGRRIAALPDDQLRALAAVAGEGVLVVIGDASALPWVDGVSYLGCDPAAPGLLLPTALAPSVHAALLEAALRKRLTVAGPLAVVADPALVIPCGAARAIDRTRLASWLAGGQPIGGDVP